jgi:anti-sigma B factor antagonist
MELREQRLQNILVISPVGRMDAVTALDFSQRFNACIEAGDTRFVVDMSGLDYISSAGLRSVLTAFKKTEARQGILLLCGLNGLVRESFQLSGFLNYFKTYDTVAEAVAEA